MLAAISPLTILQQRLQHGESAPTNVAEECIAKANGAANRNTYLHFDPDVLIRNGRDLGKSVSPEKPPLFGVPISLKDCFDLQGSTTTCGSRFYAERNGLANKDSAMAQALRRSGALITGKTHLHPLAYGITGQNAEYGDCLQPRDSALLTGGSSSGAAASVQECSAIAAVGTDTGGSIRVPAALCGLVGYRASHQLTTVNGAWPDAWKGAGHLAPSFDTVGFLLRDPRDAGLIAQALFRVRLETASTKLRIGFAGDDFTTDCQPEVLDTYVAWKQFLADCGTSLDEIATSDWSDSFEIFAPIQAHEAAQIHHGYFDHFQPAIRDRLRWGASISTSELDQLHRRADLFRNGMQDLFSRFDLLMLPASPVSELRAASDLTDARQIILRYTTPFSLAGLPAISLPGEMIGGPFGTGVQIAAAPGHDGMLLDFARTIGDHIAKAN